MKLNTLLFSTIVIIISGISHAQMTKISLGKTEDGHFTLPVSINKVSTTFILDTGATGSLIDENELENFMLVASPQVIKGLRTGDVQSSQIDTKTVQIQNFKIGNTDAQLARIFTHVMTGTLDKGVTGLVGQDAIVNLKGLVNVAQSTLLLPADPQELNTYIENLKSGGYTTIFMQPHSMGFHYVDAMLAGKNVRLIVDTGAPSIVLDKGLMKGMGLTIIPHATAQSFDGSGNWVPLDVLKNGTIRLNNIELHSDPLVSDLSGLMQALNVSLKVPFVGVIGLKELVQLEAIIDLSQEQMYIR
jgi:predicted aspartyl protease